MLTFSSLLMASAMCLGVSICLADTAAKGNTAPEAAQVTGSKKNPVIQFKTNKGTFSVRLNSDKAPVTVANFLQYVDEGFFNGTIFHRVIPDFMIQGGGFTKDMVQKPTHAPIKNEADNGLTNKRGTIAMARTGDPDSATAQFFINTVDNPFLNHRSKARSEYGYCVFGEVISGMDVIDAIRRVPTRSVGMHQDVPVDAVVIEEARVVQGEG